jgi:hypothetical protein
VTAVTLLEKAYGSFSQQRFETMLSFLCKDLKVKIRVKGKAARDWVQIDITGEDEPVALKLLDREVGLAPVSADAVGRFSGLRGKVIGVDKSTTELRVDVGVFEPRISDTVVPLQRLQAQLADGKDLPLQRMIQLFCLVDFMPVHIKIVGDLNSERGFWQAELSETQLFHFNDWLRSNLDRLIVLGASVRDVEVAVERSRHFRDVLRVEALGLFEHAVLCKLGTDAVGLMPKLGPYMRHAFLTPFSPRRIKEEIKREEY